MNERWDVDQHVGEMISGYLDGELTQQQSQCVDLHVGACGECARLLEELRALRARMGDSHLSSKQEDAWREEMDDPTVQLTRGIGWLLLIGAGLIIAGAVVVLFWTDSGITTGWKLVIGAFYLGLAGLFVSVIRQRLIERKTDKYKDVEI